MKILKPFHPQLPLTAASLFQTVKKSGIRAILGGEYCHFGLADGIKQHMRSYGLPSESFIELQINIDELPLFKSSQLQVWPILCCICNSSSNKDPFVVGIFSGNEKPGNLEEFLGKFVDEMILLLKNGICYCDRIYDVVLNCLVCDAPAPCTGPFKLASMMKEKEVPGAKWNKYKCRILKNNISKQTEYNLTQAHASKDYRFKKILCDKSIKLQ